MVGNKSIGIRFAHVAPTNDQDFHNNVCLPAYWGFIGANIGKSQPGTCHWTKNTMADIFNGQSLVEKNPVEKLGNKFSRPLFCVNTVVLPIK
jgi:hypothetical protein